MQGVRLITVGLATYPGEPSWLVPEASQSREEVEREFSAHGAACEDWTKLATTTTIGPCLERWTTRAVESHVVYWVGHGEYADGTYRLALSDTTSPMTGRNTFTEAQLWEALRDQQRRRTGSGIDDECWVLVILDSCGSWSGAYRIWAKFEPPELPKNLGVIATTDDGAAFAGNFSAVLSRVMAGFTGNDTNGVPLKELMRRLEDALGPNKVHHAFAATATLPTRSDARPPLQAPVDVYAELRSVLADVPAAIRNHYYAKAQGSEVGEVAWYFQGRHDERHRIAAWLRTSPGGMFVVTGRAGSGKSAVLGMILAATDEALSDALVHAGHDRIPDDLRPHDVTFDAVLHLSGRTIADTVTALATDLQLPAHTVDELADQLRTRVGQTTVLADALDESRDSLTIAALLRRLAAIPNVRILVGTRQSLREDPDDPNPPPDRVVLDTLTADPEQTLTLQRDPDAVRDYIRTRLASRKPDLPEARVAEIAAIIASYDQPFLFARLASYEILADPAWLEPDADLRALLGSGHGGVFDHSRRRYQATTPSIEILLHALAYARGNGFPRTAGIWTIAASALTNDPLDDTDVDTTLNAAGPYIMQDSEAAQSVYRLAHRSFTERYLKADTQ